MIVSGYYYAEIVAKKMKVSQQATLKFVKRLKTEKFITTKKEGRIVRLVPNPKKISSALTEYVGELYRQEAGAASIVENFDANNRLQNIQNSLTALNEKPEFWKFLEAYFKALVQVEYKGSMQEAFALFTYDVPIDERLKKLFDDNGFDFIDFIKPSRSFLGRRVATQLEAQIREVTSRKN